MIDTREFVHGIRVRQRGCKYTLTIKDRVCLLYILIVPRVLLCFIDNQGERDSDTFSPLFTSYQQPLLDWRVEERYSLTRTLLRFDFRLYVTLY